jgi:phage terminase large subunit-like protein
MTLRKSQQLFADILKNPSLVFDELERRKYNRWVDFFPDNGPYQRAYYPKHIQFLKAGSYKPERCFMAANRVGKTITGAYETFCHATGLYPDWWEGKRFDKPTSGWAASDTRQTTRDILQLELVGPMNDIGSGMIPKDNIVSFTRMPGVQDAIETVKVKHVSGGVSEITFKSFDQGRKAFQGTSKHYIWLDEEPPQSVYSECLTRTMTVKGIILCTFTPLSGMTDLAQSFIEDENKFYVNVVWDDVPHLTAETKRELAKSYMPHELEARTKGVPSIGSGKIYPVRESDIICDPFKIPDHFRMAWGMDVGWNRTALVLGAYDTDNDILYLIRELYMEHQTPQVNAQHILDIGDYPIAIDPASRQRNQKDGTQLIREYRKVGLRVHPADNRVESGLMNLWQRMTTGKLKAFRNMDNWWREFRMYARDENGKIIKRHDHLMDAMRYLNQSGLSRATYYKPNYKQAYRDVDKDARERLYGQADSDMQTTGLDPHNDNELINNI